MYGRVPVSNASLLPTYLSRYLLHTTLNTSRDDLVPSRFLQQTSLQRTCLVSTTDTSIVPLFPIAVYYLPLHAFMCLVIQAPPPTGGRGGIQYPSLQYLKFVWPWTAMENHGRVRGLVRGLVQLTYPWRGMDSVHG